MLNEKIKTLPEPEKDLVLKQLSGEISKFFLTCGDSNCDVIWQDWMDICPDSLDHKGWEDEGLLRIIASNIKKYVHNFNIKDEEFDLIEKLSFGKVKITDNNKDKIQQIILKYATGALLTTGWGLLQTASTKGKTNEEWVKIKNHQEKLFKSISYLIYKKEK